METNYFWDAVTGTCLGELDENGDVTVQYTTNPQTGELISENHAGEEVYHHYDGDGNTRQTTDSAGNVLGEATYTAFGETVAESGDMNTTYLNRGRQGYSTDSLTGDQSRGGKDYSPSIGRHLSLTCLVVGPSSHGNGYSPAASLDGTAAEFRRYADVLALRGRHTDANEGRAFSFFADGPWDGWPSRQPHEWRYCFRSVVKTDNKCQKFANCAGGHAIIIFGELLPDGSRRQPEIGSDWHIPCPDDEELSGGNYGCGWAGGTPHWEMAFRPTSCRTLCRSNRVLMHGRGAGNSGENASNLDILDCLKKLIPGTPFRHFTRNCIWWAKKRAIPECGLRFCTASGPKLEDVLDRRNPGLPFGGRPNF